MLKSMIVMIKVQGWFKYSSFGLKIFTLKEFNHTTTVQGLVDESMVSANHWSRSMETYTFPWLLMLVSVNHVWSNSGQV